MLFETYRASVDAFVAANRENVIRDIKRLVDVPSVEGPAEPGKPFGPGPAAALAEALKLAGVDMSSPEPVRNALKIFKETIDQLKALRA